MDPTLITKLQAVGGHVSKTLLLKNAIRIPDLMWKSYREELRQTPEDSFFAHDAAHRLVLIMGAAGYRPLIERHDTKNEFVFVHAKGAEETRKQFGYRDTRFKLPSEPATVYPYKPIGPSLETPLGQRLDMVCPDIVAYILVEKRSWDLVDLGPKLFKLEDIEKEVSALAGGQKTLNYLRERHFQIGPDFLNHQSEDLGLGGVSDINLLGPRSGDEPKYMRFDASRVGHDEDEEEAAVALQSFKNALIDIGKKQQIPMHLERGDVLLVNNRRVATQWLTTRRQGRVTTHQYPTPLTAGDRVVLRMSFFQPSSKQLASSAAGRANRYE
ncbi:MAG: hypothetical protein JNK07_10815 [Alphaproteobacteria bacterium]|nr:hypothetical protein [Alphaproteobacteria bacterium]